MCVFMSVFLSVCVFVSVCVSMCVFVSVCVRERVIRGVIQADPVQTFPQAHLLNIVLTSIDSKT